MIYYNNDRIKEKLGGKSPVKYRLLNTEKASYYFVQLFGVRSRRI
ncbi:IS3 family transposase [Bacillus sp. ISL-77]